MKSILLNDKVLRASIGISALIPSFASADTGTAPNCSSTPQNDANPISSGAGCAKSNSNTTDLFGQSGIFHTIANVLIYIVGAVAVIMLIIGGLRYVISQGDKSNVESAKNTILYAVIGIVVAILAYAIVNFVTSSLTPAGQTQ